MFIFLNGFIEPVKNKIWSLADFQLGFRRVTEECVFAHPHTHSHLCVCTGGENQGRGKRVPMARSLQCCMIPVTADGFFFPSLSVSHHHMPFYHLENGPWNFLSCVFA